MAFAVSESARSMRSWSFFHSWATSWNEAPPRPCHSLRTDSTSSISRSSVVFRLSCTELNIAEVRAITSACACVCLDTSRGPLLSSRAASPACGGSILTSLTVAGEPAGCHTAFQPVDNLAATPVRRSGACGQTSGKPAASALRLVGGRGGCGVERGPGGQERHHGGRQTDRGDLAISQSGHDLRIGERVPLTQVRDEG